MNIDGTEVTIDGFDDMGEREALRYLQIAKESAPDEFIRTLQISRTGDGKVALDWLGGQRKFQRIRRITGYLVGDMTRWNNAKRAEEQDRVKHGA